MSVSLWQDQSDSTTLHTEILVVGAGITGASAAFWLGREGLDTLVIDAGDIAYGASGRSGGMLLLGTADPYGRVVDLLGRDRAREIWEFTRTNRQLLEEHVLGKGELDDELRLVRTGTTSASISAHEQSELERAHQLLKEDGFAYEMFDEKATAEAVDSVGFHGALLDPAGMTVDPARLTRRIMSLANDSGAKFEPYHRVFDIDEGEDGVVVKTDRATIHAQMVLLCTNAFSPLVDPHFEGRVYPARGQMVATEPAPKQILPWGIYCDFGYEYLWQLPTLEIVAGGWRQHAADAEKGYSDETTSIIQEGIEGFLARHFPAMADLKITHRWAGVMGFSGDGLPFIGDLPGKPRVKYLAGHTGHGLGFAFASAQRLIEVAIDGASPGWLSGRRSTLQTG